MKALFIFLFLSLSFAATAGQRMIQPQPVEAQAVSSRNADEAPQNQKTERSKTKKIMLGLGILLTVSALMMLLALPMPFLIVTTLFAGLMLLVLSAPSHKKERRIPRTETHESAKRTERSIAFLFAAWAMIIVGLATAFFLFLLNAFGW